MVNINLTTSDESQRNKFPFKKGLIYLVGIALVWTGIYGGLIVYQKRLEKKTEAINLEKTDKEKNMKEGNGKDIFDFQTRLLLADSLIKAKNNALESLEKLQGVTVDGIYFSSYEYNEKSKSLILTGEANNYNVAARQILNFKSSEYFSNVNVSSISKKDGKISFLIKTTIN